MELTRPGYAVIYVILLCALAKTGSEGKRWKPHEFYGDHGVLSSSLHLQGKREEQAWKHGRKELLERNNDIKDFDFEKATKFLPPNLKQNFLDCIRKIAARPSPVSEDQEHQLRKHYVPLSPFGLESDNGRYLISEPPHNEMPPSPGPVQSPESESGSPISHGPAPVRERSPSPTPKPPDDDLPFPIDMFAPYPPPPPPSSPPPQYSPPVLYAFIPGHSRQRTSIIIGAATSGLIILIGLLLCYCEVRKSRKLYKDDRPLLVLSDMSGSHNVGLENSDNKDGSIIYGKNPSIARNLSIGPQDNNASLGEASSSEGKGQVLASTLNPPPGGSGLEPPQRQPLPPPALVPCPPPPPRVAARPPPAPPKPVAGKNQPSPLGPLRSSEGDESADAPKVKLKPFFWDKVAANPDQAMVWHEIKSGSFQFSEEKIESLFGCTNQYRNERRKESPSLEPAVQYIQIIDPKKAQNLSILLRALNVSTAEIVDALKEGNEIPVELSQTLLKMAPTTDEELKLRLFTGDISQLAPAERFLKVLVDIPFAFKRLESLLFMFTLPEEVSSIKECFSTLEVSCDKLRKSRLFLKLLEAVLKTGNRMNDGTYRGGAQAFRLDTLLKLADVKGTDGKTTLLHFVVQEIIRSEGVRAVRTAKASRSNSSVKADDLVDDTAYEESEEHYRSLGLQVVSGLISELEDVKRAAVVDGDSLTAAVLKLDQSLTKSEELLSNDLKSLEEDSEFQHCLASFVEKAKEDVSWLMEEEKRIMAEVKRTADYFHGKAGEEEGLRLFVTVRDFLRMLDKVCKEVKETTVKPLKGSSKKEAPSLPSSPDTHNQSPSDVHRRLFPAIAGRRIHDSSSDDDGGDDD